MTGNSRDAHCWLCLTGCLSTVDSRQHGIPRCFLYVTQLSTRLARVVVSVARLSRLKQVIVCGRGSRRQEGGTEIREEMKRAVRSETGEREREREMGRGAECSEVSRPTEVRTTRRGRGVRVDDKQR